MGGMMALRDLLKAPLDTSQADAKIFMERIQGNILKGHDRSFRPYLPELQFGDTRGAFMDCR
jgi:hypothetical protein